MLVLYSPLLQNLIEMVASLLVGVDKTKISALGIPSQVE